MGINSLLIEQILRDSDATWIRGRHSYIGFIVLWVLFEAWGYELSDKEKIRGRDGLIEWLEQNDDSVFNKVWDKHKIGTFSGNRGYISQILSYCPVIDKGGREHTISNPQDPVLHEIINVVYEFRNRLIHGECDITDNTTINLLGACAFVLHKLLRWLYHESKS